MTPHSKFLACSSLLFTIALCVTGCGFAPQRSAELSTANRSVTIERTAYGIPHIAAANLESLSYGIAYAYAQDNVCQVAQMLVTARGERSTFFGGTTTALFGFRPLPNEQIDTFVAAHMNDAALERSWLAASNDAQALSRGYVAGYNRFLVDNEGKLPAACNGQSWVKPMSLAEYRRATELTLVQASLGAFADAVVAAKPPTPAVKTGRIDSQEQVAAIDADEVRSAMRDIGIVDSPYGSNAWAFGKDVTANGSGVLLGNPHFPWVGANRFWQMHLTVPGDFDVMGASTALGSLVQIGFNRDVAWSHTVSTGKRFTLHELSLDANDPTVYMIDGKAEAMSSKTVTVRVRNADGTVKDVSQKLWSSRWGPIIVNPRAGLNWNAKTAYALKDANTGNARSTDTWLAFARAKSNQDLLRGMQNLGLPWVNTIAADRAGTALYADLSVVPDVDADHLKRCAPSAPAAALVNAAGLFVLNGSKSDCDWRKDTQSGVPGLIPTARMPSLTRTDWVHNSNDSFFYTHPDAKWSNISPLVGDDIVRRARTRSGLIEVPALISRGKITPEAAQRQLFENRNLMARLVLPDLLAACVDGPETARAACAVLRSWNRTNDIDARGAHLFREFWRTASGIKDVYREAYDKARPVETPRGLRMTDAAVASKVWDALSAAAKKVTDAGFALDAPLGQVQRPIFSEEPIAIHGGDDGEGVLNNIGDRAANGITAKGIRIDYGTSYVQSVGFDERGPVANAILTYGQSTNPVSPHVTDQLKMYSKKSWIKLPFHRDDVVRERVGEVLTLVR
ncbi:MAG: acylase [Betaproteobacteria bacterium]|nr:MAG: acylase [Betaproteobacteria bacterium]